MRRLAMIACAGLTLAGATAARAEETMPPFPKVKWSFDGIFGTYDRAAAQRGFQVWSQVCANCHAMKYLSYRNLAGIGLSEAQIRALAADKTVPGDLNDQGEPTTRPGLPGDRIPPPYPNEKASRAANNGAYPPDHSLIELAREGGPDYIHALMLGYVEPPKGVKVPDGLYYNKWFLGHQIHMAQPLQDDTVTYTDGTKATLDQEARDVTTFLAFAANPHLEERHRLGVKMVGFFAMLVGVTYVVKKRVWAHVDH